ncbi:hypothetical protein D1831_03505 [Lactiplantibacillus garii]|uniref:Uncharacterized protein n=1 Tax=Lactiplantibacillus garii TaxID=2306423 RepID=A0A426D9C6_9LACO|nr:hypothetical protein [Lactiplantibacillus garii]RRK11156.1 hypothetical protein D1831_03505 [Lactiplantibacillus garii]
MKKSINWLAVVTATLGITMLTYETTASAKHHATTVPTSLRGHWYHYNSTYGLYDQVKATKYHFYTRGATGVSWHKLSGKKFPKGNFGYPQMATKKYHGAYLVGKFGTDGGPLWKKVMHNGHATLRASRPATAEDVGGPTKYYYKTKKIAKQPVVPFKTAKSNDFSHSKYRTAYLQADYGPMTLYTSLANAKKKQGSTITISSLYKKYSARWDKKDDNYDRVRVNGKAYFAKDTPGIQTYNSWREGKIIYSPYSPSSKSKIVIKHGDKTSKAKYWFKSVRTKGGSLATDTWTKKNGAWIRDY